MKRVKVSLIVLPIFCPFALLSFWNSIRLRDDLNFQADFKSRFTPDVTAETTTNDTHQSLQNLQHYPSVDCKNLLELQLNDTLPFNDPNDGSNFCKKMQYKKSYWMSLHKKSFDKVRWYIWENGKYYEHKLVDVFIEILEKAKPDDHVLDVGGNIGTFSLLSASSGPFIVDAFEPNKFNVLRFCESLKLNSWIDGSRDGPTVSIHNVGVGSVEGVVNFRHDDTNPGMGRMVKKGSLRVQNRTRPAAIDESIQSVKLDNFAQSNGWFESRPSIAILKVDVEGFEPNVFKGAKKLVKSGIIQNIIMEASFRTKKELEDSTIMLQSIADAGYKVAGVGFWLGPDKNRATGLVHNETLVSSLLKLSETKEGRQKQLNIWWERA